MKNSKESTTTEANIKEQRVAILAQGAEEAEQSARYVFQFSITSLESLFWLQKYPKKLDLFFGYLASDTSYSAT